MGGMRDRFSTTQTNDEDRHPVLLSRPTESSMFYAYVLPLIWHPGMVGGALHMNSATADVNHRLTLVPVESLPLLCGNVFPHDLHNPSTTCHDLLN